jgi:secondary thiamine-phosphate synthase enzyme
MRSVLLTVSTRDRRVTDLTEHVRAFVREAGSEGLVNVFVPHATAGIAIMETGAGSEDDLEELLNRVWPRDDRYRHRHGSPGHGSDHVIPVLIAPSITIPALDGQLQLGTWQSVVLVDPNRDNDERSVRLSWVPA